MRTIFVLVAAIATAVLFTMTMGNIRAIRAMRAQLDALHRPVSPVEGDTYIARRKVRPDVYNVSGATITANGYIEGAKSVTFSDTDADYRERRSNPYRLNAMKDGTHD